MAEDYGAKRKQTDVLAFETLDLDTTGWGWLQCLHKLRPYCPRKMWTDEKINCSVRE